MRPSVIPKLVEIWHYAFKYFGNIAGNMIYNIHVFTVHLSYTLMRYRMDSYYSHLIRALAYDQHD